MRGVPVLVSGVLAAAALAPTARAGAQALVVAPHGVILDARSRGGAVTLLNRSTRPVEVTVDTRYGYPQSDSLGAISIPLLDTAPPGEPDATPWVTYSPKRFIIPPGRGQAVRFLARPPEGLADGEYWSRVIFSSKNVSAPRPLTVDTAQIRVGIDLQVKTVIPIIFRKGPEATGLTVGRVTPTLLNDSTLRIRAALARTGSNAWIGRWRLRLLDGSGKEALNGGAMMAVYRTLVQPMQVPIGTVAPGPYTGVLTFETDRTDLAPRQYVKAPTVEQRFPLTVPSHPPLVRLRAALERMAQEVVQRLQRAAGTPAPTGAPTGAPPAGGSPPPVR